MANKYTKINRSSGRKQTVVRKDNGRLVCSVITDETKKTTLRVPLHEGVHGSVVVFDGRKARAIFLALKKHYDDTK